MLDIFQSFKLYFIKQNLLCREVFPLKTHFEQNFKVLFKGSMYSKNFGIILQKRKLRYFKSSICRLKSLH